ncbi:hypothetical protein WA026_011550 [Henosepilachna vigintioctopunctata]|uniref:Alpha-amylase n=1 Tax=Henosepilachna vigintioctopunctata TaxID=420089 RepID=A0AAW1TTZ9_9CUCU
MFSLTSKSEMLPIIVLVCLGAFSVTAQKDPHFVGDRSTIVHLFEWKWLDIAKECEEFLAPHGYGGVQISPPQECLVVANQGRPWWERYQPTSYQIISRSGNEQEFQEMTRRCNNAGVRIYVDIIMNHMTGMSGNGIAGSSADAGSKSYPSVPYGYNDFHQSCSLNNYNDPNEVRNCELSGLKDLNQGSEYVRGKLVEYLNHLIDLGVAGFRVDAAKHMWPADLSNIYGRTKNLNTQYGFPNNARAFVYQEVIDFGDGAVRREEYTGLGRVCEFRHGTSIGNVFQGHDKLTYLKNWGTGWGFMNSNDAVNFVENHDTQRDGDSRVLNYKNSKPYKMAIAFMLAHPYGQPKVMSGYDFNGHDQGPPQDGSGNLISPKFNGNSCVNGWICEHRWRQIYNMATFRATVKGTDLTNWWSNNDQQIAFCRGDKGFVAFTNGGDINQDLNVCVPEGRYCDVISGEVSNGRCTGKVIEVRGGRAHIQLSSGEDDGVIAIHVNAKL